MLYKYNRDLYYQNQQNNINLNNSKLSNNILNSSGTNDTIKILNLLKTDEGNDNKNKLESIREYNYEDILAICIKVFMYYAKPKNGQFYLSYNNVIKILKNCDIINEKNFKNKDIDILIQKINKGIGQFTSENFLDLLTKICMCLNTNYNDNKKEIFTNFVRFYLEPFCCEMDKKSEFENSQSILNDTIFENKKTINVNEDENRIKLNVSLNFKKFIENYSLDQNSYLILSSILKGLKQIYKHYFIYENNNHIDLKKIEKNSFNNFITFCREFEIFPYLINKNLIEFYWSIINSNSLEKLINNSKISLDKFNHKSYNIGIIYSFPKFVLLFSHIASYYFYSTKISKAERLLYLIEKIYHSKGYNNLNKNLSTTYNKKYSIVPPKEVIELINKTLIEDEKTVEKLKYKTIQSDFTKNKGNLQSYFGLNDENFKKLDKYLDKLKDIFNIYSQIGDKFQFRKLTFSNFQKLLYDGGLLDIKSSKQNNLILSTQRSFIYQNSINKSENIEKHKSNKSVSLPNINSSNLNISKNSDLNRPLNQTKKKEKLNLAEVNIICSILSGYINYLEHNTNFNKSYINFNKNLTMNTSSYRNNTVYKFDFFLFIKSLPLISLRLFPNENNDINESMKIFLNDKIKYFINNLSEKLKSCSLIPEILKLINSFSNNLKIKELIKDISPLIHNHFLNYANSKNRLIDFDNFLLFFKDFDIYPHWISLTRIKEIFYAGCSKKKEDKEEENFDYKIFIQCFIVIAVNMNSGDDFDWIDKVLFMIDKMFIEGCKKSLLKSGKTFTSKYDFNYHERLLMEKYPSYYKRKYTNCDYRYGNKHYFNQKIKSTDNSIIEEKYNIKFNDIFMK